MKATSLGRISNLFVAALILTACSSGSHGKERMATARGDLSYTDQLGDIWAEGTTIFLAARGSGNVYIIDASDPDLPVEVGRITGAGFPQDVKAQDGVLYVTDESGSGVGLRTYDVSDPTDPLPLGVLDTPGVRRIHNVFVDGSYAYVASNQTSAMHVIDVSDPAAPVDVAQVPPPPGGRIHDMMARDGTCYAAFLGAGFMVVDVSTPTSPVELATHGYDGAFTHGVWPSESGKHLFTTDEVVGGHLRAFDIRDLSDIQEVGSYEAKPGIIIHNVIVRGRYAYIAYYVEGLHIVDVQDPTDIRIVASFDTYPGGDTDGFAGAWGVYPFTTPYVYVSDLNSGLHIFKF